MINPKEPFMVSQVLPLRIRTFKIVDCLNLIDKTSKILNFIILLSLSIFLYYQLIMQLDNYAFLKMLTMELESDRYYLPTPPLGQDKTQGQFLSGV